MSRRFNNLDNILVDFVILGRIRKHHVEKSLRSSSGSSVGKPRVRPCTLEEVRRNGHNLRHELGDGDVVDLTVLYV